MDIAATARLRLRTAHLGDADFYLALVNDPGFLEHIGDRGIRTRDDAVQALLDGPMAMQYARGHSLYVVELKEGGAPIGMCGLIKRDTFDDVDIGFAFLPAFRACGYAAEAAQATLAHGFATIGLRRIIAITSPDNAASGRLLEKVGLRFERMLAIPGEDREVRQYACAAPAGG